MKLLIRRINESIVGQHLASQQILTKLKEVNMGYVKENVILLHLIGGPGTGKTLLVRLMEEAFRHKVYHLKKNDCELQITSISGLIIYDNSRPSDSKYPACFPNLLNSLKVQLH